MQEKIGNPENLNGNSKKDNPEKEILRIGQEQARLKEIRKQEIGDKIKNALLNGELLYEGEFNTENLTIEEFDNDNYVINTDGKKSNFPEYIVNKKGDVQTIFSEIWQDKNFDRVQKISGITEEIVGKDYKYMKDGKEITLNQAYSEFKKELLKIRMIENFQKEYEGLNKEGMTYTKEELQAINDILLKGIDKLSNSGFNFLSRNDDEIIQELTLTQQKELLKYM